MGFFLCNIQCECPCSVDYKQIRGFLIEKAMVLESSTPPVGSQSEISTPKCKTLLSESPCSLSESPRWPVITPMQCQKLQAVCVRTLYNLCQNHIQSVIIPQVVCQNHPSSMSEFPKQYVRIPSVVCQNPPKCMSESPKQYIKIPCQS